MADPRTRSGEPPPMSAPRRPGGSVRARVRVIEDGNGSTTDIVRRDDLATEEPLETRLVAGPADSVSRTVNVTMRTPGHDFELAAGWLVGEGVIETGADLHRIDYCTDMADDEQQYNVVTVTLTADRLPDSAALQRHTFTSSACGVCGASSIEAVMSRTRPVSTDATLPVEVLYGLPERLRQAQGVFTRTGGLHAAGLFTLDGAALVVREDVGRHNAVDKVVGSRLLGGAPGGPTVLMVSGRTSFEIVQKATAAGIAFVAGVSAPSSLAVQLAQDSGVTLVGFLRGRRANVYSCVERVTT